MKRIIILIGILLLVSGCYDYKELNDMSIISAIGIDYVDNEYKVSLEITESSKDGSSTEIETKIVSGKDSSISRAFDKAKNMSDKMAYLEHVELLIISESLAYEGINDVIDYIIRDTTINNNYFMVVSDSPEEMLNTEEENMSMSEVIVDTVNYTQGGTRIDDIDILTSKYITGREDIALPYITLEDKNVIYNQIAYFNGDKMVGMIDYKMYTFLVLDTKNVLFTKDDNTINVFDKKISYDIKDNEIVMNVKVDGQISEISKNVNLKDTDVYGKLEKFISKQIKKESMEFIDTVLKNNSDLLGFKDMYYKRYKRNINEFDYEVKVDVTISKNGTIYEVLDDN